MKIEAGGTIFIETRIKPGYEAEKVDLKKPIVHTVSKGPYDFTVTAFPNAFIWPQECLILNGLIRFPLPPHIEGTN